MPVINSAIIISAPDADPIRRISAWAGVNTPLQIAGEGKFHIYDLPLI